MSRQLFLPIALGVASVSLGFAHEARADYFHVRLGDPVNGFLNCRSSPDTAGIVERVFLHGQVLPLQETSRDGKWVLLGDPTGEFAPCWVSVSFGRPVAGASLRGLFYVGPYQVEMRDPVNGYLNCRQAPAKTAAVLATFRHETIVETTRVHFDDTLHSWFYTKRGCYVFAGAENLTWAGLGEDPNTMCNPFTEGC